LSAAEAERLKKLLARLGLPTSLEVDRARVVEALEKDKKRENRSIHFVLLDGIGRSVIEEIAIEELTLAVLEG
jgi:3-dehydroquinate synthase